MNRRHVLSAVGSTLAFTLAGCISLGTGSTTETRTVEPTTRATDSETPCTVPNSSPLPSATVPDESTTNAAKSVALAVERSYASHRAEADGWTVDGIDSTDTSITELDAGYLVEATVRLDVHRETQFGTETDEETLYGSFNYSGWYRVTTRRVERAPGKNAATPPGRGWTTVACA